MEDQGDDDQHGRQSQGGVNIMHGQVEDQCGEHHRAQLDQLLLVEEVDPGLEGVNL